MGLKITVTPVTRYEITINGESAGVYKATLRDNGEVTFKGQNGTITLADNRTLSDRVHGGGDDKYQLLYRDTRPENSM